MSRYPNTPEEEPQPRRNPLQTVVVGAAIGAALLYLVNPTLGVLEFLPDNLPLVGNLDEATATAILISGLNYFGINIGWLTTIFGRGLIQGKSKRNSQGR